MIEEMSDYIFDIDCLVSETFVYGHKRRLCIPISEIITISIGSRLYINNSAKNKVWLKVRLKNNEVYNILVFSGILAMEKLNIIKKCTERIIIKNPEIKIIKE